MRLLFVYVFVCFWLPLIHYNCRRDMQAGSLNYSVIQRSERKSRELRYEPSKRVDATSISSQAGRLKEQPYKKVVYDNLDVGMMCSSSDIGIQVTPATVEVDSKSDGSNSNECQSIPPSTDTIKEKTPMCLVNELARFNKVTPSYVLIDERGPAHKKEFFVSLELGAERYEGVGKSIKKAQHAAAEAALQATNLKKPIPRVPKSAPATQAVVKKKVPLTPTVELNSLIMKLGMQAEYRSVEDTSNILPFSNPYLLFHPINNSFSRIPAPYLNQVYIPPLRRLCKNFVVTLKVGEHEFKGEGVTKQLARHAAASKALGVLRDKTLSGSTALLSPDAGSPDLAEKIQSLHICDANNPVKTSSIPAQISQEKMSAAKSEISLLHELALHSGRQLAFEVVNESGPPHLRSYKTRCICGDLVTEAEGNSKKTSKKKAAEHMLEKMAAQDDHTTIIPKQKHKNIANKKKNRNIIKVQKANLEYGSGINPISRLIQIQQANKGKEPSYTVITNAALVRLREFVIQVECNGQVCQGRGPNKKLAKRNAAEEMLQIMGYSKPTPLPSKSALKTHDATTASTCSHQSKHVTFLDSNTGNRHPGVIVRPESPGKQSKESSSFRADFAAAIAKELMEAGKSVTCETMFPTKEHPKLPLENSRTKLEYLCKALGLQMEYTDFPKGSNTNMCLSLVALQTNPAQVFHGMAPTTSEAHEKAALQALKKFVEFQQDNQTMTGEESASVKSDESVRCISLKQKDGRADSVEI